MVGGRLTGLPCSQQLGPQAIVIPAMAAKKLSMYSMNCQEQDLSPRSRPRDRAARSPRCAISTSVAANLTGLVLGGGGGGGRPDYLQKLKVSAVSKPNFASKYSLELGSI